MKQKMEEGTTFQKIAEDNLFPEYYSQDRFERKKNTIEQWYTYFEELNELTL